MWDEYPYKRDPRAILSLLLPHEDTEKRQLSMDQETALSRRGNSQHLDLRLEGSRTIRNKCLLFDTPPHPPVYGILL